MAYPGLQCIRALRIFLAVAALCGARIAAAAGDPPCKLVQVAELPVALVGNAPVTGASIDGQIVPMLIDTGATDSMIWRSAAGGLNLKIEPGDAQLFGRGNRKTFIPDASRVFGAGGSEAVGYVTVSNLALGGATLRNLRILAAGHGAAPGGAAGVLGQDLLSRWDMELDFPNGKMRLFDPKHCRGDQVAYWAPGYYVLEYHPQRDINIDIRPSQVLDLIEASVYLDGREIDAMFDTGSTVSQVTPQALKQTRVRAESDVVAAGSGHGLAGKQIDVSAAIFATLRIGQETIQNVRLRIVDIYGRDTEIPTGSYIPRQVTHFPGMIIGADFFKAHRVYFSRAQNRMYFTYSGGPVFEPIPTPRAESH